MGFKMIVTFILPLLGLIYGDPLEYKSDLETVEYSRNLDNPQFRLLNNVQPSYYYVDLSIFLSESNFHGIVRINVEVLENLQQIVLHQNVGSITAITIIKPNNQVVALQLPNAFETDSYYQILKINLANQISPGNYTIRIKYLGEIKGPLERGIYKGYYFIGNETREYATTQFEPFYARSAFPCFDEPHFKSRFVISIVRDAHLSPSFSNMAIQETKQVSAGRIRETFLPTPVVSTYLVAFHVSDFVTTSATSTVQKPFQIISRPGPTDQHAYAADIGLKITNELDKYFEIGYYDMGQGNPMKNDHIALPDFVSGAMENWGMVNYRETYLLYDDNHTNIVSQISIATTMAHELAHKWFGNLVTCFWWSNLWLNESFASYFEYFAAHWADPSLELDKKFIVDQVQSALASDTGASVTAMNWINVTDNPSIKARFSISSYAKGASVLRMMEHFVGIKNFRNALKYYLNKNAYGVGYPSEMYEAFEEALKNDTDFQNGIYANVKVKDVFDSWVLNPGAPVVKVNVDTSSGIITLSQERFQLSGSPPDNIWYIPITWTHGGSPNFNNIKPSFVFQTRNSTIQGVPGDHWVILNLQYSGLYRVNYDDSNWAKIAEELRSNNIIHEMNRAQIVNDVLTFLIVDEISINRAFDVISFLKNENSFYVWNGALTQLDWIRGRLEHVPDAHKEFDGYLLDLIDDAINEMGYEDRPNDSVAIQQGRMIIMNYACTLGHEGCITNSVEKWNRFRNDGNYIVPKNARRYVYCTGLRNGQASDYQFLYAKYNSSENAADMVVILRTLACTKDNASVEHYLFQTLHNSKIRLHDRPTAFRFALQGNRENLEIILQFLFDNFIQIRDLYGGQDRLNTCINAVAAFLTDFEDILKFQRWVYERKLDLGNSLNKGVSVVRSAMNNLHWGTSKATQIVNTINKKSSSTAIAGSMTLVLIVSIVHSIFTI